MKNLIYIYKLLTVFASLCLAFGLPAGCTPPQKPIAPTPRRDPPVFVLAPPGKISSLTLLPPNPPPEAIECTLKGGNKAIGGAWLPPALEASLGGELERLAGLPLTYQQAERSAALLSLDSANLEIKRLAAEVERIEKEKYSADLKYYHWRKAAPALFYGGAAAGLFLGAFFFAF